MQQELGIMKQHLFPAERVIGTLLNLGCKSSPPIQQLGSFKESSFLRSVSERFPATELQEPVKGSVLLAMETVDFLEEVQVSLVLSTMLQDRHNATTSF